MDVRDVIRAAMPGATDEDCDFVIWARTPFPFSALTAQMIYKAASGWARASAKAVRLCDWCDNIASDDKGGFLCDRCRAALTPNV